MKQDSVASDGGIELCGPGVYAAGDVGDMREPLVVQEVRDLHAAASVVA